LSNTFNTNNIEREQLIIFESTFSLEGTAAQIVPGPSHPPTAIFNITFCSSWILSQQHTMGINNKSSCKHYLCELFFLYVSS